MENKKEEKAMLKDAKPMVKETKTEAKPLSEGARQNTKLKK